MNMANKQYIKYFELSFLLSKNRIATVFYQQQKVKMVAKFKFKIVKDWLAMLARNCDCFAKFGC